MTSSVFSAPFPPGLSKNTFRVSVALSVLLILCGIAAILVPIEMSYGVTIVIAWLLMFAGFVQLFHLFRCRGIGNGLWKLAVASCYLLTGLYLRLNLSRGVVAITLALAVFFISQALFDLLIYLRLRKSLQARWLVLEIVATLLLGLMVLRHWPFNSFWIIGMFVGINMIVTGSTRLMTTLATRRVLKEKHFRQPLIPDENSF